jgi:hypothetical protein
MKTLILTTALLCLFLLPTTTNAKVNMDDNFQDYDFSDRNCVVCKGRRSLKARRISIRR